MKKTKTTYALGNEAKLLKVYQCQIQIQILEYFLIQILEYFLIQILEYFLIKILEYFLIQILEYFLIIL